MAGPYSPNPGKLISSTQPITQPLFEMLRTHSIFSEYSEWLDYDIEQAVYKGIWAKKGFGRQQGFGRSRGSANNASGPKVDRSYPKRGRRGGGVTVLSHVKGTG